MRSEILSLKDDLAKAQANSEESERNRKMLEKLFQDNVIDENGNLN